MLRHRISSVRLIPLSFLAAILFGAVLLMLPISSADRQFTALTDALFTSATSTSGVLKFLIRVTKATLIFELIGAAIYAIDLT